MELAAESDEGLESLFGPESCCWGTVTPIVSRGDGTKKDVIRAAAEYGDCIQPAYPPAASYLSVRPKPEAAGSRQLELLFTEDIRSRCAPLPVLIPISQGILWPLCQAT